MKTVSGANTHTWVIEEIDGGNLGVDEFWLCSTCGASGGPVHYAFSKGEAWPTDARSWIFLACGCGPDLSANCEEAAGQIKEHLKICPHRRKLP